MRYSRPQNETSCLKVTRDMRFVQSVTSQIGKSSETSCSIVSFWIFVVDFGSKMYGKTFYVVISNKRETKFHSMATVEETYGVLGESLNKPFDWRFQKLTSFKKKRERDKWQMWIVVCKIASWAANNSNTNRREKFRFWLEIISAKSRSLEKLA